MSSASESESDEDDNDDDDNDNSSLTEILSKSGYDYKALLTTVSKKNENGTVTKFKPPFIASLFLNVPPIIHFVTHEDKCNFNIFIFKASSIN